jgi:hypothetical protein
MQRGGLNRAWFVVEDTTGCCRFVESTTAGGKLAIRGAETKGVPYTITSSDMIEKMKTLIERGALYALTYVAPGLWDTIKHNSNGDLKAPYVVVGFRCAGLEHVVQHLNEHGEIGISRSTLGKLVGPSGAKHLITKGLGGQDEDSLIDALMNHLSIDDFPHLSQSRTQQRLLPASRYAHPGMAYGAPFQSQQQSTSMPMQNPNNVSLQSTQPLQFHSPFNPGQPQSSFTGNFNSPFPADQYSQTMQLYNPFNLGQPQASYTGNFDPLSNHGAYQTGMMNGLSIAQPFNSQPISGFR